jgi:hypothetical protein
VKGAMKNKEIKKKHTATASYSYSLFLNIHSHRTTVIEDQFFFHSAMPP